MVWQNLFKRSSQSRPGENLDEASDQITIPVREIPTKRRKKVIKEALEAPIYQFEDKIPVEIREIVRINPRDFAALKNSFEEWVRQWD